MLLAFRTDSEDSVFKPERCSLGPRNEGRIYVNLEVYICRDIEVENGCAKVVRDLERLLCP